MINEIHNRSSNISRLTDGFIHQIWSGFHKAIELKNYEVRNALNDFILERISIGVSKRSQKIINQFISLPNMILIRFQNHFETRAYLVNQYSQYYKNVISYQLRPNEYGSSDQDMTQRTYESIYYAYVNFLHIVLETGDETEIASVLEEFNSIYEYERATYFGAKLQIMGSIRSGNIENSEISEKSQQALNRDWPFRIHSQAAIALKSWVYYLYVLKKIDESRVLMIDNQLRVRFSYFEELLFDLDYISNSKDHLGLQGWDTEKRKDGVVYSPPDVRHWASFGLAIIMLVHGKPTVDYKFVPIDPYHEYLASDFQSAFNKIRNNYEFWKPILNMDLERFTVVSEQLLEIFVALKARIKAAKNQAIVNQPLSDKRTNEFILKNQESFLEAFHFLELAKHYNCCKFSLESDKLNSYHFERTFERFKMSLVKKNRTPIMGAERLGAEFAQSLDRTLSKEIFGFKAEDKKFDNPTSALEYGIDELRKGGSNPNLIIVFSSKLLRHEWDYHEKSKFVPVWNYPEPSHLSIEDGQFDNIPVVSINEPALANKILICDFNKSFELEFFKANSENSNILSVGVRELSQSEVNLVYSENPKRWLMDEEGINLSEEEAKILLATSLRITLDVFYKLHVADVSAFMILDLRD